MVRREPCDLGTWITMHKHMPTKCRRSWLEPYSDHSSFQMLSKVNPVVSDWLGKTAPNLFVPEPKNVCLHSSLPFVQGVEIFSAIRMREKYYSLHDCLDGLCSAGDNHSGDGRGLAFSCSDPIPPVAVATDQPAEHVLSRSAGSKGSSRITMNIFRHHSPYEAREFSGNRRNSNISFLSVSG